jgi:hypothetical protein
MKKYFRLAAIAVVAMALTVACKSKAENAEDTIVEDTVAIEEVVEEVIDTVAEELVAEPVKTTTTAKKADEGKTLKATTEASKDLNANAQSRIAKKKAASTGLTEAKESKDAPAPDLSKNAENRIKRR